MGGFYLFNMKYIELINYLNSIEDKKYAEFSKNISNSDYQVIGVRTPILRNIIKSHKLDIELSTNDFDVGKFLEIDFIYFGLSLSRFKNIDEQLLFIKNEIKKAKSWIITDTLSSFLKKCPFDKFFNFFLSTYNSKYTYERRSSYVLGLKHYTNQNILNVLNYIQLNEEYIVMMSQAWLLSTIATSYPHQIYDYLNNINDLTLKRKTISKICDSYRFDDSTKDRFKKLRK